MNIDRYGEFKGKIPEDVLRQVPAESQESFIVRLLESIEVKPITTVEIIHGTPVPKVVGVEVTGRASF